MCGSNSACHRKGRLPPHNDFAGPSLNYCNAQYKLGTYLPYPSLVFGVCRHQVLSTVVPCVVLTCAAAPLSSRGKHAARRLGYNSRYRFLHTAETTTSKTLLNDDCSTVRASNPGSIPSSLRGLSSLQRLHIGNNQLSGER